VIQKGGVEDGEGIAAYLDWAAREGIGEVCFKELYVSSTLESAYAAHVSNRWSQEHQVPLSIVPEFLEANGFSVSSRLPWGSPIHSGEWRGCPMRVASYTEPSLLWERTSGIARSWNIMADGTCLVSLEDPHSAVHQTIGGSP
jgi:hypothetical protein